MTLGELKSMARLSVPGIKSNKVGVDILEILINKGIADVAALTVCLKKNTKFAVTADKFEYDLTTLISDFLTPDKPGLYWNQGTADNPDYKQLDPVTLKWFDENRPNWRDADSSSPLYYALDSATITIVPTPDTALANGFWMYYGAKPPQLTQDGQYPFSGTTTEIPILSIFDMAILKYVVWHTLPMISKRDDYRMAENEYKREVAEKMLLLEKRKDIQASKKTKFQGRRIA